MAKNKQFDGTAYVSEDFKTAKIALANGEPVKETFPVRINLLDNVVEYTVKELLFEIDFRQISKVEMGEELYLNGKAFGQNENTLLQVLHQGDLALLKQHNKKLTDQAVSSYSSTTNARRVTNTEKYFLFYENQLIEFSKSKKSFLNAVPEQYKAKAESSIKKKSVNWKNDESIAALVKEIAA